MNNRRQFISMASAAALAGHLRAESRPGQKLRVGVMGLSRGKAHINNFAKLEGVEVAYVCDVDQSRLAAGVKYTADRQNGNLPKAVTDFRRILEDKEVDILSIAAPNF